MHYTVTAIALLWLVAVCLAVAKLFGYCAKVSWLYVIIGTAPLILFVIVSFVTYVAFVHFTRKHD